jgi:outer membrane protein assembly factor BamB
MIWERRGSAQRRPRHSESNGIPRSIRSVGVGAHLGVLMARFVQYLLLTVGLLSGCGWFAKDNTRVPTELENIHQTVAVSEVWEASAGKGVGSKFIKLYPLIMLNNLFVIDANGEVRALERETGGLLWKTSVNTPISAGINGSDLLLVFGTEEGDVIAISPDDGHELWRKRLSSEVMAVSSPGLGVVVARTNDGKLYGLDVVSGELLWQTGRKSPVLTLRGVSIPITSSGKLVVGFDDGKLVALTLLQGQVQWQTTLGVPRGRSELERMVDIDGEFRVRKGIIYVVGFHSQLAAVTLSDGRILWSRELSSYTGLDVDASRIYVTDEDSNIWAFDRRTGASLWKQEKLKYRKLTAPAAIENYVIVGDFEGYIHWMSKADGEFVARTRVDSDGILSPPLAANERVYVLNRGGEVAALEVVNDEELARR